MRYVVSTLVFLSFLFFDTAVITAFGLAWSTALFIKFLNQAGKDIPLDTLLLLIASLQWIIGPWLSYTFFDDHYKYHMYVPEQEYMLLAVPALFLFSIGLRYRKNYRDQYGKGLVYHAGQLIQWQPYLPYWLIGIGIVCSFVARYVPSGFDFVFFLLANTKYIGLVYLLFSTRKSKWLIASVAWLLTLFSSIQAGFFHDLLLWTILIGLYVAYILKPTFRQKYLALLLGFFLVFLIQIVKQEYRQWIWFGGYTGDRLSLYTNLVSHRVQSKNELFNRESLSSMVVRINQGWISSKVMEYVPNQEPFARGVTINEAISASILPRFLAPNKKLAGGKETFERFTGFQLRPGTSMGVSLLGEGYANYGVYGTWLFMLVVGLFYSSSLNIVYQYSRRYPTILLWLPLIFLQVIKAETELVVVLNHLVKSLILVLGFFWAVPKFFNWKL